MTCSVAIAKATVFLFITDKALTFTLAVNHSTDKQTTSKNFYVTTYKQLHSSWDKMPLHLAFRANNSLTKDLGKHTIHTFSHYFGFAKQFHSSWNKMLLHLAFSGNNSLTKDLGEHIIHTFSHYLVFCHNYHYITK